MNQPLTEGQRVERAAVYYPGADDPRPLSGFRMVLQRGTVASTTDADGRPLLRVRWDGGYGTFATDPDRVVPVDPAAVDAEREMCGGWAVGDQVERTNSLGDLFPGVVLDAFDVPLTGWRYRVYWPDLDAARWYGPLDMHEPGTAVPRVQHT